MALFNFDPSIVPDVEFAVKDASIIQSDVLVNYERAFFELTRTAKKLGRGDPVRLFLLTNIYQLAVQRSIVDSTGKMNLIKYSRDEYLDNIGARWGPTRGVRLQAQKAATILRFSLSGSLTREVIIPYNQKAETYEGIQFATTQEGIIPAGQLAVNVPALAVVAGSLANDISIGEVNSLVSWNTPFLVNVSNVVITSGGADRESNDRFRARIWMAPESFSVAGPYGAYEFWTSTANPAIIDVAPYSHPDIAGEVWLTFLMEGGRPPTPVEKDQVLAICNADDIRPLTDQVIVKDLEIVPHTADMTYWIEDSKAIFADGIREGVRSAYEEYIIWQKSEIGLDINPAELTKRLMVAGAKRIRPGHQDPDDPTNWIVSQTRYTKLSGSKYALGDALQIPQIAQETPASDIYYGGLEPK